ncbi:discoidin domain-containing protein [Tardiphaga alba]|uniref:Discoidin domain-containing protein n=1 Tax=Tardiphaga alba TaxID=340268 RepID=A0ABX8AC72_9BRAD|nr:discoidin domain-containing protein [Tardiphaga alba]QUS40571.1 discoidin domain-containing protein [Tardiphaga alba]
MLVVSRNFVITPPTPDPWPVTADHPLVGWRNIVTTTNVAADTAAAGYPVSNLANPATAQGWRAANDSEQYITVTLGTTEPIDYVGVARHNFGSGNIPVSIEINIDGNWVEAVEERMLADDSPVMFRFNPAVPSALRVRLQEGDAAPRAAVLYVGRLLVLERKIWVGHTPLPDGIKANVANGRSQSGEFLGDIVLGEWRESVLPLSLISPDWHRLHMRPFLKVAKNTPFFFAWRPEMYPLEVGFCKVINDVAPVPVAPSNLLSFDLTLSGIT